MPGPVNLPTTIRQHRAKLSAGPKGDIGSRTIGPVVQELRITRQEQQALSKKLVAEPIPNGDVAGPIPSGDIDGTALWILPVEFIPNLTIWL